MGCTHPLGINLHRNEEGEVIAGSCPVCGAYARKGESLWTSIKRGSRACLGLKP